MTVKELIEKLQALPDQDAEVVTWYSKYAEHITSIEGISGEDEVIYMSGDGYYLSQEELDAARAETEDEDWGDNYVQVYLLS